MGYEKSAKELISLMSGLRKAHTEKHIDMFSRGKGMMLECVEKNGGVIMPGEIAKNTGVSTARVAAFLNAAEKEGYIKRQSVEDDRRKIKVILTDMGIEKVKKEREKNFAKITLFLERLGEADTENLIRIMRKMQEIVNSEEFKI